jgi:hypothetical protein
MGRQAGQVWLDRAARCPVDIAFRRRSDPDLEAYLMMMALMMTLAGLMAILMVGTSFRPYAVAEPRCRSGGEPTAIGLDPGMDTRNRPDPRAY